MGRQWTVKLLTFVGDTCGSVHKEHLEQYLEELQVLKSKWNGIRERLVRGLLEEQDTVFRCYYAAKWGGQKARTAREEEARQEEREGREEHEEEEEKMEEEEKACGTGEQME